MIQEGKTKPNNFDQKLTEIVEEIYNQGQEDAKEMKETSFEALMEKARSLFHDDMDHCECGRIIDDDEERFVDDNGCITCPSCFSQYLQTLLKKGEPLTEEKVREMIDPLNWKEREDHLIARTPFGFCLIEKEECEVAFRSGIATDPEQGERYKFETLEEAKKACQKDFEDRVLLALGFEPEKEEE